MQSYKIPHFPYQDFHYNSFNGLVNSLCCSLDSKLHKGRNAGFAHCYILGAPVETLVHRTLLISASWLGRNSGISDQVRVRLYPSPA